MTDILDTIRGETGAAVLLIYHAGKDSSRGMRGHSSLLAAADGDSITTCVVKELGSHTGKRSAFAHWGGGKESLLPLERGPAKR